MRLEDPGTGIFIIVFDPADNPKWADNIAKATLAQFFPAIQWGKLTVIIDDGQENSPKRIDRDTQPIEMDRLESEKDNPTPHYWRTITENEPELTKPSGKLGQMGQLKIWIRTERGSPKKVVHINRRGMLITDIRNEQRKSLLSQRRKKLA